MGHSELYGLSLKRFSGQKRAFKISRLSTTFLRSAEESCCLTHANSGE